MKTKSKNKINPIKFKPFTCTTSGDGWWSSQEDKNVKVIAIKPQIIWDRHITFKAYFRKKDWNWRKHGLIYTDSRWLREFRRNLIQLGVPSRIAKSIDYTEQGMQGNNYVSLETNRSELARFMGWELENES
jgi:hypothetical protein